MPWDVPLLVLRFGSWCRLSILMAFLGPSLLCSLLSSGEFGLLQDLADFP